MTTALPAWITAPVLLLVALVVGARYLWFNSTRMEHYLNNALALLWLSNLLRENGIEQILDHHGVMSVTTAQQLSLAVAIGAAAEFMGFVAVWADPEKYTTGHRNTLHRGLAAALAVAFMVAATPAREAGQTLEDFGGWSSVAAWAFLIANLVMLAVQIVRMSVTELRRGNLKRRELLVTISGIGLGVAIGGTSINALDRYGSARTRNMRSRL